MLLGKQTGASGVVLLAGGVAGGVDLNHGRPDAVDEILERRAEVVE